jgi:hypothetical protein
MPKCERYMCDGCERIIADPQDGFVIHGNISTADVAQPKTLIGDNLPSSGESPRTLITETVYCKNCFLTKLGISLVTPRSNYVIKG